MKRRISVLLFSPYYPPHIGGLESHADEFNKYLSQQGVDITVFTPRLPVDAPEQEIRCNNIRIIRFPAFEIIHNYPVPKFWSPKFWDIWQKLFCSNIDVVVSRTRFFLTSLMALIYSKTQRKKWVHIEHGSDFVQLSSAFKTLLARVYDYTFGRLIFRLSDKNISISKAVQTFVGKFDKRESPIIYRGLEMQEIDAIPLNTNIRANHPNKILLTFAGRLYKWKGVADSIMAIHSLPEEIKSKIVFLIIGDGEDFSSLKYLSKDEKCIEMLGSLSREDVIAILKSSDIYIHSAYPGGGLSTSLLEAMYCGCAVIATPNEGADEVIENEKNGILLSEASVDNLRSALLRLIDNSSERKYISNESASGIRNRFGWEQSICRYAEIFKSLIRQ